eukprot:3676697-Rhodomonas_salina.4
MKSHRGECVAFGPKKHCGWQRCAGHCGGACGLVLDKPGPSAAGIIWGASFDTLSCSTLAPDVYPARLHGAGEGFAALDKRVLAGLVGQRVDVCGFFSLTAGAAFASTSPAAGDKMQSVRCVVWGGGGKDCLSFGGGPEFLSLVLWGGHVLSARSAPLAAYVLCNAVPGTDSAYESTRAWVRSQQRDACAPQHTRVSLQPSELAQRHVPLSSAVKQGVQSLRIHRLQPPQTNADTSRAGPAAPGMPAGSRPGRGGVEGGRGGFRCAAVGAVQCHGVMVEEDEVRAAPPVDVERLRCVCCAAAETETTTDAISDLDAAAANGSVRCSAEACVSKA